MKLRNKKTGKIVETEEDYFYMTFSNDVRLIDGFTSIKDFNEIWEDVDSNNATNIPLIKDDKIRKAVRAWAEANSLTHIQFRSGELGDRFNGADLNIFALILGKPITWRIIVNTLSPNSVGVGRMTNPFPKSIYLPAFQEAKVRAEQNLEDEELEKFLKALKAFMRNFVINN